MINAVDFGMTEFNKDLLAQRIKGTAPARHRSLVHVPVAIVFFLY